jgi:hypothetical protein
VALRTASPLGPPAAALPADADPVPLYRTRIPPPATLRYAMRLAGASGSAELRWRPAPDGYALRLDGAVAGGATLAQFSQGGFDVAGLAPVRHTEQRTRRAMLATNFQRETGKISFSGSGLQFPLAPGSQDRLSWLIQLACWLPNRSDAWPARSSRRAGRGLRGEAGVWLFRTLAAGAGERLRRSGPHPAGPSARGRMTSVEVPRSDPSFPPVELTLRASGGTATLELTLVDAVVEP